MQINDCTIDELGQKLEEMMKMKVGKTLYLHELDEENIFYIIFREVKEIYYLCKDGLCVQNVRVSNDIKELYIPYNNGLYKVTENDLEYIAENYHEYKRKMEKIQQEIEAMEKVLDSQKIRGLFAKMKTSK